MPSKNKYTLIRKEYFGASICSPSGEPFRINHEGMSFIEHISNLGIKTNDRLLEYLSQMKTGSKILHNFIEKCKVLGWNDAPFNWFVHGITDIDNKEILSAPYSVYLYPSLGCNLRNICNKCYVYHSQEVYKDVMLSPENIKPIVDECVKMGVFHLTILGGEPLVYPHLFELLEYAVELPLIVSMSSNGILLSQENVSLLSKFIDRIQISLDGPKTSSAELLKGKDTFEPTISAIKRLVNSNIYTTVSYVLTTENSSSEDITEFVSLMVSLGVHCLSFIQYYPSGDSAIIERVLDTDDNKKIKDTLDLLSNTYKEIDIHHEASFVFPESQPSWNYSNLSLYEKTSFGCDCGRTRISIYPNGDVIPCDFLANRKEYIVGNIFNSSLIEIWNNSPSLNKFRARNVLNLTPCKSCEYQFSCTGGCQAMALMAWGDINMPDPRCPHVKKEMLITNTD
ncbi:MAG: radical SAM protein [Bacteroidales bacterium]|nr:radical SAM protein [Bacteroidales bacterium]